MSGARVRGRRCGGSRLDCGDQGLGRIGDFGRADIGRVQRSGIGVRCGRLVDGGWCGPVFWDIRGIEERANLAERHAERDVFNESGANDFFVGSGEFGKYETAGWTLLRQNFG